MIKNLIFLGAPGVGKGTIAKIIEEEKGIQHISTGEIFRQEVKQETKLGLKIKEIIALGDYVSDELTNEIIQKYISNKKIQEKGFILDGYPRTIEQAKFLKFIDIKIDAVVLFVASDDQIMERLIKRARNDDKPKTINNRLKIYDEKTKPLINFYKKENILKNVNAEGTIEENYNNLLKGIFNEFN